MELSAGVVCDLDHWVRYRLAIAVGHDQTFNGEDALGLSGPCMALQAGFEHAPAGQAAAIFADDSVPDRFFFRREVSGWWWRDRRRWRGDDTRLSALGAGDGELSDAFPRFFSSACLAQEP